jgi:hypothetical protein
MLRVQLIHDHLWEAPAFFFQDFMCEISSYSYQKKIKKNKNWACCWDTLGSGAEKDGKRFLPSKTRMLSGDFATGYLGSAICPCWIPQNHCYQSKKYLHQSQNVQTLTLQDSKGTNSVNTNQAKPGIHGELCMFRGRCQSNVTSSKARCLQIFRLPLQRLCYLGQPRGARRCRMVVKPRIFRGSWIALSG